MIYNQINVKNHRGFSKLYNHWYTDMLLWWHLEIMKTIIEGTYLELYITKACLCLSIFYIKIISTVFLLDELILLCLILMHKFMK